MDKQKFRIATKVFREILQICPRLHNQEFVEPSFDEEMVPFIKDLGYTSKYDMLYEIHTDQMHQPWRRFAAVINRFIFRKSTGLDKLRPLRAQILWGMFYKKNDEFTLILEEEPAKKPKQAKHPKPAKESAPAKRDVSLKKPSRKQSTGVQIRDTPGVSVSKKKTPATTDRSKGIDCCL
nr:hypothetical protein [Tanacetum cinerariifolium]